MKATICAVCKAVATETVDVRSLDSRRTSMIDTRIDLCDAHAFEIVDGMLVRLQELQQEGKEASA